MAEVFKTVLDFENQDGLNDAWNTIINARGSASDFLVKLKYYDNKTAVNVDKGSLYINRLIWLDDEDKQANERSIKNQLYDHNFVLKNSNMISSVISSKIPTFSQIQLSTLFFIVSEASRFELMRRAVQKVLDQPGTDVFDSDKWLHFRKIYTTWNHCMEKLKELRHIAVDNCMLTIRNLEDFANATERENADYKFCLEKCKQHLDS